MTVPLVAALLLVLSVGFADSSDDEGELASHILHACHEYEVLQNLTALQPHLPTLAVTERADRLTVTWATLEPTCSSAQLRPLASHDSGANNVVHFGGNSSRYTLHAARYRSQVFHTATLELRSDASHEYRVGCAPHWTGWRQIAPAHARNDVVRASVLADIGVSLGGQSALRAARHRVRRSGEVPNVVVLAGDVAYSNGDASAPPNNAWDHFQALLAPLAAHVPLAAAEGNHDGLYNEAFVPLRVRLAPPARWFAFDRACVRFVVLTTEADNESALQPAQLAFLRHQLSAARAPDSTVQWLVVVGHRPLYDSNKLYSDATTLREQLVPLFDQYRVDLYLSGHQHDYERTPPLRQHTLTDTRNALSSRGKPYQRGNGTVYIVAATERRKLRRLLTGHVDVDGVIVGTRAKTVERERKAERKARRRQGHLGDAVLDLLRRAEAHSAASAPPTPRDASDERAAEKEARRWLHPRGAADWLWPAPEWSARRTAESYGYGDLRLTCAGVHHTAAALRWRYWLVATDGTEDAQAFDEVFVCSSTTHRECAFDDSPSPPAEVARSVSAGSACHNTATWVVAVLVASSALR